MCVCVHLTSVCECERLKEKRTHMQVAISAQTKSLDQKHSRLLVSCSVTQFGPDAATPFRGDEEQEQLLCKIY